jgi:hypothetical protein
MTAGLFILGVLLLAGAVLLSARRYLSAAHAQVVMLGLPAWLLYVGLLSWTGVIADLTLRPPGILFVLLPVFLFIGLFAVRSQAGLQAAVGLPIGLLIGAQVFRVPVEIGLHRLWAEGLVPRLMTYEGGNVDLFVGLTAPLVAWLAARGAAGRRLAVGWNVVGLLALLNIIVRSALTAPGPFHLLESEVPNLAIATFPFTFLAGFFAPMAVLLHVLSLRRLAAQRGRLYGSPLAHES